MTWTYIAGVHIDSMRFAAFLVSLLAAASAAQNQPAGSIVNVAENGDLAAVQEMLADPALPSVTITEALVAAAIAGHRQIVKVLLQDARSNPGEALRSVGTASRSYDIYWLIYFAYDYASVCARYDLAQFQRAILNQHHDDKLDILTFRCRHDPAILECHTELQLARVQVPRVVQSAFQRAIYNLSGHRMTIDGYRQLANDLHADQIKIMMILAHLFDSSSTFSFLISDLVRLIGKFVDAITRREKSPF